MVQRGPIRLSALCEGGFASIELLANGSNLKWGALNGVGDQLDGPPYDERGYGGNLANGNARYLSFTTTGFHDTRGTFSIVADSGETLHGLYLTQDGGGTGPCTFSVGGVATEN